MSEDNPWVTHGTRIVYKNNWITVREDQVTCPDGQPGIYGVVSGALATGVVAINEKNEIYLVGQFRYSIGKYSWEIPEGGALPGEDALSAAKRELQEEAGIVAESWTQMGEPVHTSNCISDETAYLYLAKNLKYVGNKPDPTEVLKVKCVPFAEALNSIHRGDISDGMSIIGIARAQLLL